MTRDEILWPVVATGIMAWSLVVLAGCVGAAILAGWGIACLATWVLEALG